MPLFDVNQEEWGSQRIYADFTLNGDWMPDKFVVHYGGNRTLGRTPEEWLESTPTLEMIALRIYQQSHLSKGWQDIGYNYAIGNSGTIYRLRGENHSGATSGDYEDDGIPENSEAVAVLWIGGGDQIPSQAAYDAMASLFVERPELRPITAHSDHKQTSCPGNYWRDWIVNEGWKVDEVEALKNILHALVDAAWDSGNPNIHPPTEDGREYWHGRVEQIENPAVAAEFYDIFVALFKPWEHTHSGLLRTGGPDYIGKDA